MTVDEMSLHEVGCCECGKPISTIPTWLALAKVRFQCEECRQRHPRIHGMGELEPRRAAVEDTEDVVDPDDVDEEDEEMEDEAAEE
jgi:hypothetical protein